jgi:SnoaL-like domain
MNSTLNDQVPAVVREALAAANGHDISRFLGCFAADGAVDDWGRFFTGHAQIRRWSDAEFVGKNVTLSDLSFTSDADRVAVQASVGGDGYTGPSTFTFTVHEAKIRLMRITA